jgi:hypothetical protein
MSHTIALAFSSICSMLGLTAYIVVERRLKQDADVPRVDGYIAKARRFFLLTLIDPSPLHGPARPLGHLHNKLLQSRVLKNWRK